LHSYPQIT